MDRASLSELLGKLWVEESETYPDGEPFVDAVRHGTMSVELFAPRGEDPQEPHAQDELYIVIEGSSRFRRGEEVSEVKSGDVMFVPARLPHRFEDISDDFMTWVVFWGPEGGEGPNP